MFRMRLFFFSLFLCSFLFSEEEDDPFTSSYVETQEMISTNVGGVSTITGDWIHHEVDFSVAGPVNLNLSRIYSTNPSYSKTLGCNWDMNRPHDLSISRVNHQNILKVRLPSGSRAKLSKKDDQSEYKLYKTQGLTNCRGGVISGRTNLHNLKYTYKGKNKDGKKECHLTCGDGTLLAYRNSTAENYFLHAEEKPDKNKIVYHEKSIEAYNPGRTACYGSIKFSSPNKQTLKIESSDGKKGIYTFATYDFKKEMVTTTEEGTVYKDEHQDTLRYYLKEVSFNHKPKIEYVYDHGKSEGYTSLPEPIFLRKINIGDRYLQANYYKEGTNHVSQLGDVKIEDHNKKAKHRVKELYAPAGYNSAHICIQRFIYDFEKGGKGKTTAYDAYLRKTVYCYNRDLRPYSIEKYSKANPNHPYSSENYIWDAPAKDTEEKSKGNLIGKYKKNEHGQIISGTFLEYDDRENVSTEKFYGILTGKNDSLPILMNNQIVEGTSDCYQRTFTYSNDIFNLLTSEKENNGRKIRYQYFPNTNLVSSKFVEHQGRIYFRQFFKYDDNTSLIESIRDDGSGENADDYANITERHITRISNRKSAPFGLPEDVQEYYWDPKEKKEILLSRKVCDYYKDGRLKKEDHYDACNQLQYSLTWEYDAHGNLTKETNAIGQTIVRTYDANDNLEKEFAPTGNYHIKNTYDLSNRLIKTEYFYKDGKNYHTSNAYDHVGNLITSYDRFGQATNYDYDDFNRLIRTTYPEVKNEESKLILPVEEKAYDAAGNIIATIDPLGNKTTTTYNTRGKPLTVTHPDGTVEKFIYQLDGALEKKIDINGLQTVYQRDFLNRVLREELYDANNTFLCSKQYRYVGFRLAEFIDAEGYSTSYFYDGAGRKLKEVKENLKKLFEYDTLNRLAKITQVDSESKKNSISYSYQYDLLNRKIEEALLDGNDQILTQTFYEYDDYGNCKHTWQNSQAGKCETYHLYDDESNLIQTIDPEGNVTRIKYDYLSINDRSQYVLTITKTDPEGKQTIIVHDALGRVKKIIRKDPFGKILSVLDDHYDAKGQKIFSYNWIDGNPSRPYVCAWGYNAVGQEKYYGEACGTPEQKFTVYEYNTAGQKSKVIKSNGTEIHYHYDALGRVADQIATDGTINYHYSYDFNNQVIQVKNLITNQSTDRSYNAHGQITWDTLENGLACKYSYDDASRLKSVNLPDMSSIEYEYQATHLTQIKRLKNNRMVYKHHYQNRDKAGLHAKAWLPGRCGEVHYKYDPSHRIKSIHSLSWKQDDIRYNSVGLLTSNQIQDEKGIQAYTYAYDSLDHLIQESGDVSHTYQTDSLHNRLSKNNVTYQYNVLNQLLSQGTCQYDYNKNGNLETKREKGVTTFYAYDALDRLVKIMGPQGVITYTYDAFNRRMTKNDCGLVTHFFYQGQNEIGTTDSEGEIKELRILGIGYGAEIGAAVAFEFNDHSYVPIHDHLGHVASIVDMDSGVPKETYRYTAFGEQIIYSGGKQITPEEAINPWRFASKRVDKETGWVFFGRRYYDPTIGRWTTPDPIGFEDGPNLYAYLHHNPLSTFDAYGCYGEDYASYYRESQEAAEMAPEFAREWQERPERNERNNEGWCSTCITTERFLGGLQVFAGVAEASLGGALCALPTGITQVIGGLLIFHGCDNMHAGSSRVYYNAPRDTATVMMLESAGMSRGGAELIDSAISIAGSMGGSALVAKASQSVVKSSVSVASNAAQTVKEGALNGPACSYANAIRLKNSLTAQEIAGGHAFEKHILTQGEFPGMIRTRQQFAGHIENVLNNPTHSRSLHNGRSAFWHEESGTIVVRTPQACDGGTAFQSRTGVDYYHTGIN